MDKKQPITKLQLLEWSLMNLDIQEVMEITKLGYSAVYKSQYRHDVFLPRKTPCSKPDRKPRFKADTKFVEDIRRLAAKGYTRLEIAELLGATYDTTRQVASLYGIKIKKAERAETVIKPSSIQTWGAESLLHKVSDDVKRIINGKWR